MRIEDQVSIWKVLALKDRDYIVTAYAQPASGPSWANSPIYVVIMDGNGKLREECIQPEDQTPEMFALYPVCAAASGAMRRAVCGATEGGK